MLTRSYLNAVGTGWYLDSWTALNLLLSLILPMPSTSTPRPPPWVCLACLKDLAAALKRGRYDLAAVTIDHVTVRVRGDSLQCPTYSILRRWMPPCNHNYAEYALTHSTLLRGWSEWGPVNLLKSWKVSAKHRTQYNRLHCPNVRGN